MLEAIVIFLAGLVCGIIAGRVYFKQQQNKIKVYESYIHRRLEAALPNSTRDLGSVSRFEPRENTFR